MGENIILVVPKLEHKKSVIDFKQEFFAYGEKTIDGSELLDQIESYEEWLIGVTNNTSADTVAPNWVVTDTFLAVREKDYKLIGIIDLRHSLNEFLKDFGHIGYSVRPTERKKGYATIMLAQVIQIAKRANIKRLQLSCADSNIPSRKTILNNSGIYERHFEYEGKCASVYKINTNITTPLLTTKRLLLRPLKISDAQEVFNGWASKEKIATYMRWNQHTSVEETKEWLASEEENANTSDVFNWGIVIKETNMLIGSGGLLYNAELQIYEIGYNLNDTFWGNGFATEAGVAMVEYALHVLKEKNIFAVYAKDNSASGKVLEKLGFRYIKDGEYSSYDGKRCFEARELLLKM